MREGLPVAEGQKWPSVAAVIAARIRGGDWPVGSRLPRYEDLAREVGVAQLTARKAVAWLAELGYLKVVPSVGVDVVRRPPARLPLHGPRRRDPVADLEAKLSARLDELAGEVADLRDRLDEMERGRGC